MFTKTTKLQAIVTSEVNEEDPTTTDDKKGRVLTLPFGQNRANVQNQEETVGKKMKLKSNRRDENVDPEEGPSKKEKLDPEKSRRKRKAAASDDDDSGAETTASKIPGQEKYEQYAKRHMKNWEASTKNWVASMRKADLETKLAAAEKKRLDVENATVDMKKNIAIRKYAFFYGLDPSKIQLPDVADSSSGIEGWAAANLQGWEYPNIVSDHGSAFDVYYTLSDFPKYARGAMLENIKRDPDIFDVQIVSQGTRGNQPDQPLQAMEEALIDKLKEVQQSEAALAKMLRDLQQGAEHIERVEKDNSLQNDLLKMQQADNDKLNEQLEELTRNGNSLVSGQQDESNRLKEENDKLKE